MRTRRRNAPHEITSACQADHCHSHNLDEPAANAYRICGECFHAYPSARALRRDYIAGHREVTRHDWQQPRVRIPVVFGDPFKTGGWSRVTRLELAWLWLTAGWIRANKIYFCPHCLHDF